MIGTGIFPYIYHVGCTFNLHSIINNGLVPGGQNLSRRQTVFFLPVDPRNEDHKDPEYIDFSVPRLARYMHSAWKRHQDAVFWVDIDLGIREGLTFYQTRSNAIILQGTLPAHYSSKVERLKTGEMLYERRYLSPRPPPKIPTRCRQGTDLTSRKHCRHCTASRNRRTMRTMKIGRTVPLHGGNGKQPGGIPIMRLHHKDGANTDRTGKPV